MVWASETCEEREENGLGLHGLGIRNMRGERRKRVRTPWSGHQKHARREKKTG